MVSNSTEPQPPRTGAPHEARKLVTVLFADLERSTQLGELLDIEPLREVLIEFFDAMSAVVDEWGGTVEKYIGDAIVAVFGVPTTGEDDAVRALRAGLEMQDRLASINPSLKARYGVDLSMRVGVNTGEVLSSTESKDVLAGDVFNVAARLEGVAEPGTVVVSERTHHATEGSFEMAALGEFTLKGKSVPQDVWRVLEPHVGAERPIESEMVGRVAELGMLASLMEQTVSRGRPQLVTILGETGIGKSRLVGEFISRQSGDVRSLLGRCLPYGHGITFWPLREVLWEAAGIVMDDTSDTAASKLRSLVDGLPRESVVDSDWLASALATTAGITLPDSSFDQLSPESAGEELQLAWPAFATALASERPTLLVIEDLHWAERPLLDMIEHLALRGLGPVLIVATARPEFMEQQAGWGARAIPSQISLGPLTEASFGELMEQLLPDLDDEARHRILDSAEGNPFFAEEIARHAVDEGLEGAIRGQVFVPDTARSILAARIDQLDPVDLEVLQHAAVIGEVFWPAPLTQMRDEDVDASLAALERSGFIATRPTTSLPGQREMAFRHSLMRDVAYQSITRRRLAPTHSSVAEWTEALASDRRDEFIEVIAHHYAAAAQTEVAGLAWQDDPSRREQVRVRAGEALVEAGDAARRRFSIDQAVEYSDRALQLASSDGERLKALELKASSYHAAARVDEAWPVYLEAISAARAAGDEADISRVTTGATLLWSRYAGAFTTREWQPAALDIMETRLAEIGEEEETAELAALLLGRSRWGRREHPAGWAEGAIADAKRAIFISEKLASERLLSHALDGYSTWLREEGLCELGDLADRMVKLGSEMADRRQGHEMLITSAVVLAEIGRNEDSREVGVIAHTDAQEMGVHLRIHGIQALTAHMVPTGKFHEIIQASDGLLELIVEDGGVLCDFGGGAVANRALALFEQGRTEQATETLEFYKGAAPDTDRVRVDGIRLIERVRPFVGLEQAERLIRNAADLSVPRRHLYYIRAQLPVAVLQSDWAEAERLIAEARDLAEPCCAPQILVFADWAEAVRDGDITKARATLATLGEPYTSARLAVDFLGTIPSSEAGEFRADTETTLRSMGAEATLAELSAS